MAQNFKSNNVYEEKQVRFNAINIATNLSNSKNPAYIVDRKLLDVLLSKYTKGTLDDIKAELIGVINKHDDKDKLFDALDNHIYCNSIASYVSELDDAGAEVDDAPQAV